MNRYGAAGWKVTAWQPGPDGATHAPAAALNTHGAGQLAALATGMENSVLYVTPSRDTSTENADTPTLASVVRDPMHSRASTASRWGVLATRLVNVGRSLGMRGSSPHGGDVEGVALGVGVGDDDTDVEGVWDDDADTDGVAEGDAVELGEDDGDGQFCSSWVSSSPMLPSERAPVKACNATQGLSGCTGEGVRPGKKRGGGGASGIGIEQY
jgi:hypothetical protein